MCVRVRRRVTIVLLSPRPVRCIWLPALCVRAAQLRSRWARPARTSRSLDCFSPTTRRRPSQPLPGAPQRVSSPLRRSSEVVYCSRSRARARAAAANCVFISASGPARCLRVTRRRLRAPCAGRLTHARCDAGRAFFPATGASAGAGHWWEATAMPCTSGHAAAEPLAQQSCSLLRVF